MHCVAVLLDHGKNAWKLLAILTILNAAFLCLVIATKPFRDSDGHTGYAMGDKAQVVAQLGLLVECALAALCLASGGDLPALLEGAVIVLSLGAIVFPIIYMWRLSGGSDMLACLWPEEAEDPEAVTVANPAAATSSDKNSGKGKKKGKGKGKDKGKDKGKSEGKSEGKDNDSAAATSTTHEEE